jgi:hypothetical protein
VSAKQVTLFVAYNEDLWFTKPKPTGDGDPLGFAEFGQHLTAFDRSGDMWAHFDGTTNQFHYLPPSTLTCEIPTWAAWSLHPQHISKYRVPAHMVLVTRERKDMIDRQLERNIVHQEEARCKREFNCQARNSTLYPARCSKVDVRAVISTRNREMRDDTRALDHLTATVQGVRVADEVDRAVVPALAGNTVVPAPPPLGNQLGEAGARVPTPAQILAAGAGPSSTSNIPPIATINPSHLVSTTDHSTDLNSMSNEELFSYLDSRDRASNNQTQDVRMG